MDEEIKAMAKNCKEMQELREKEAQLQYEFGKACSEERDVKLVTIREAEKRHEQKLLDLKLQFTQRLNTIKDEKRKIYERALYAEQAEQEVATAPVSIHHDVEGNADGVRVCFQGEDFIIALHDMEGTYTFDSAADKLKELGLATFNKKQGFVLCMYIEEINAMLEEAGGDPFKKDWYVSSELYKPVGVADYYSNDCWCFGGNYGVLNLNYRYYGYFRCRPFLA